MRQRALNRRGLCVGAGVLAASVLSGCQGTGTQFVPPGRETVTMSGAMPTSPAFSQVAAGQTLPVGARTGGAMMPAPQGGQMVMMNNVPTYTGQPMVMNQPMVMSQPMVGSGGMVYPVGYTPGGPAPMTQPIMSQSMVGGQMQMMPQAPMMSQPGMMMPSGTPGLSIIQTPTGPQYVATPTEMTPTMAAPTMAAPTMAAPTTAASPQNYTAPGGTPSFVAPPPGTIPAPALPAGLPAEVPAVKAPEPLPPTVGALPATAAGGAVLPAAATDGPRLGSFPTPPAPVPAPAGGPKLPPATGPVEDDIPPAPIFVPGGK
jgi:hypothetical protein